VNLGYWTRVEIAIDDSQIRDPAVADRAALIDSLERQRLGGWRAALPKR
jgi:hypothetical protein